MLKKGSYATPPCSITVIDVLVKVGYNMFSWFDDSIIIVHNFYITKYYQISVHHDKKTHLSRKYNLR